MRAMRISELSTEAKLTRHDSSLDRGERIPRLLDFVTELFPCGPTDLC
jgi:hypothetical protein